jgi:hypothetical protein
LVPAINIVKPANVSDVTLMPYFLEQVIQRVPFPIHAIVADKGYIDASIKEDARKELAIPIVTGVRDGMSPPEGHGEFGPECFYGVPLIWDQYDPQTHENLYLAKGILQNVGFAFSRVIVIRKFESTQGFMNITLE